MSISNREQMQKTAAGGILNRFAFPWDGLPQHLEAIASFALQVAKGFPDSEKLQIKVSPNFLNFRPEYGSEFPRIFKEFLCSVSWEIETTEN